MLVRRKHGSIYSKLYMSPAKALRRSVGYTTALKKVKFPTPKTHAYTHTPTANTACTQPLSHTHTCMQTNDKTSEVYKEYFIVISKNMT